ncbi:MAG: hypothetical protein ACI867_001027 [Glaciecola sp.]
MAQVAERLDMGEQVVYDVRGERRDPIGEVRRGLRSSAQPVGESTRPDGFCHVDSTPVNALLLIVWQTIDIMFVMF